MLQRQLSWCNGWCWSFSSLYWPWSPSPDWYHWKAQWDTAHNFGEDRGLNTMRHDRWDWQSSDFRCLRQECGDMDLWKTSLHSSFWQDPSRWHGLHQRREGFDCRFNYGWSSTTSCNDEMRGHEGHSWSFCIFDLEEGTFEEDQSRKHSGTHAWLVACLLALDNKIPQKARWLQNSQIPWQGSWQQNFMVAVRFPDSASCAQPSPWCLWVWTVCSNSRDVKALHDAEQNLRQDQWVDHQLPAKVQPPNYHNLTTWNSNFQRHQS